MTTAATISAKLILDAAGFNAGLKTASSSAGNFASKMNSVGSTLRKIGAFLATGFIAVQTVRALKDIVGAAMESENAIADLEATLKSTGGVAGLSSKELQDYASKMQMVTKFSDEQIISGQAMLLTFTKIGKDVFPQAADAMLNLAEKFGSMESASIQIGKALQDPISGVQALRRVGVMLSDQQEKQVKAFMAVNDIASAQGIIIKELNTEFGGLAVAAGNTTTGQIARMKNVFDEIKETLGRALLPALKRLADLITREMADPRVILFIQTLANKLWKLSMIVVRFFEDLAAGKFDVQIAQIMTVISGAVGLVATAWKVVLLPTLKLVWSFISTTLWPALVRLGNYLQKNLPGVALTAKKALYIIAFALKTASTAATQLWQIFNMVFGFINRAINTVIITIGKLVTAFANLLKIKLPSWLTPGSPTPFEMGLRGINSAMDELSRKKLPAMNTGLNFAPAMAGIGGGSINIQDNRRFNSGISATDRRMINQGTEETIRRATGLNKR